MKSPLTIFCGCPGQLAVVGDDPTGEGCFLWRTDQQLLRSGGQPGSGCSLFELACEIADLYHHRRAFYLADIPGEALEVIWLELAADDALLVFLKPVSCLAPA